MRDLFAPIEVCYMKTDVLVVGAGFAGSVIAERCATAGMKVVIIDKREHIAGNAYDELDPHGVLVHRYGPHIFHTNAPAISEYLSRFTTWIAYEHRVLAQVDGHLYPVPVNQTTVNKLYGLSLDEQGMTEHFKSVREVREPIRTSEDSVLASVGRDLCDKFFRGYTRKQWGLDLSELDASVAARVPVRTNTDDRYFSDSFQKMPAEGYTRMFARMLKHPNIRIETGVVFEEVRKRTRWNLLIYTGPIDEYFKFCFGKLPYRSLRFDHEHVPGVARFQPVGTVNYPNDHTFTRITEFKHLTGQDHSGTSIVREYPEKEGDPYYPVPRPENQQLYQRYSELAKSERNVLFVGRLAEYRYYNMDQVVARALMVADKIVAPKRTATTRVDHVQPAIAR
jgi:UDP-galactopyranose mutase